MLREIKDVNIFDTSYEDNSKWLELTLMDGSFSYELLRNRTFLEFKEKQSITTLSKELAELINNCRLSDDDMLFVEVGEIDDTTLKRLKEEVFLLNLYEYIEFGEDPLITIYGGIITKFTFPNPII
ncbi:hypothetical protein [Clostridium thermobutyricum]|uniref:hypothetical protein n=1 Tax=Clostridium thermobutyricum TaxID=29372 RepID=UPI0018AC7838|nr:hypothetical protein [Clostridium thermobutyricum]